MSNDIKRMWDDKDFEEMSWHDNHFHGFNIVESEHGKGILTFDIDYILEWIKNEQGEFKFSIAPAKLTFYDVFNIKFSLDYASASAASGPFSIDSITREYEKRQRYTATIWKLIVNWPNGNIQFEASKFKQELLSDPVLCSQQRLMPDERSQLIGEGFRDRIRRIEEKALRKLKKKKEND